MKRDDRMPVIIGAGQAIDRWTGADIASAPSPVSLGRAAAAAALQDTGSADAAGAAIDIAVFVRLTEDSVPFGIYPSGRCDNLAAAVCQDLGLSPSRHVYSTLGGEQPQALVNEFAAALHDGVARAVLLTGAEAVAAQKLARRNGLSLDWSRETGAAMEDRGQGELLLDAYEIANGLGFPPQVYALFDHALRARRRATREEWRRRMSEVCARLSRVAAENPYAQFGAARSADFIAAESAENFPVSDPYLKWHVAQDAVNQGAALILTTAGEARALGVPEEKFVYLHGASSVEDCKVSKRADLSHSRAIERALADALAAARMGANDIAHFDVYSCFPCVVELAAEYLRLDAGEKALTVTGGLPFFGGPGNNYSMHAIASMVERLRKERGKAGLVLANGGFMTKAAAGVYSTDAPADWLPARAVKLDPDGPPLVNGPCDATIETYTVFYARSEPVHAYAVGAAEGGRVIARVTADDRASMDILARGPEPIGRKVRVEFRDGVNVMTLAEAGD